MNRDIGKLNTSLSSVPILGLKVTIKPNCVRISGAKDIRALH